MPFIEEPNKRATTRNERETTYKRVFVGQGIAQHNVVAQLEAQEDIKIRDLYPGSVAVRLRNIETEYITPSDSRVTLTYSSRLYNPSGGLEDPEDPDSVQGFPVWSGSSSIVRVPTLLDLDHEPVKSDEKVELQVPEPVGTAQCAIRWANPDFSTYSSLRGKANNAAFYLWTQSTVLYMGWDWSQNESLLYEITHHFELKAPDHQFHYYPMTKTVAKVNDQDGHPVPVTTMARKEVWRGANGWRTIPEQTSRIISEADFDGLQITGA